MATVLEAQPLARALGLKATVKKPFRIYSGGAYTLIISGIGKAHAAMAATHLVTVCGARTILNAGAAGALSRELPLGGSYQVTRAAEPDRPKIFGRGMRTLVPDLLEGFPGATLATQDRPMVTPGERRDAERYAQLADMEGAAVIQAARLYGARCYLFKFVSDTPDHKSDFDIVANIRRLRGGFAEFLAAEVLPRL
jgi:adenosylhomocysteine nucleosidase